MMFFYFFIFLNQQFITQSTNAVHSDYKVAIYIQMETTWRRKREEEKKREEKENEKKSKRIEKSIHKSTK